MKMKKLLAAALALAMVAALVPGLAVTAGAEEAGTLGDSFTDAVVYNYIKEQLPVFDAVRDFKGTYKQDMKISDAWDGWSGGNGDAAVDSDGTFLNVAGSGTAPRIQVYSSEKGGNGYGHPQTVSTPGYGQNSDFILFRFKTEYDASWGDVAFKDSQGSLITSFRFGSGDNNSFNVSWGHSGWATPFGDDWGKRAYSAGNAKNQTVQSGVSQIDILIRKKSADSYVATYFCDGSLFCTAVYEGTFEDLRYIVMSVGAWGKDDNYKRISLLTPSIYAGNYSDIATNELSYYTVNYSFDDNKTVEATKTYYDTNADNLKGYNNGVIFPNVEIPYFEGYVFHTKAVDAGSNTVTLSYKTADNKKFFDNVSVDTKLTDLNMLGAHDAFTAGMNSSNVMADAANITLENSLLGSSALAASAGSGAIPYSRAQSTDAYGLLEAGVRYFDIRLSRSSKTATYGFLRTAQHTNGVFYTTHGLLSNELRPILFTIGQWAKAHPGEIIALDFQSVADTTDGQTINSVDGHGSVQTWNDINTLLVESGIYSLATISDSVANVTYGELTDNGKRSNVLIFAQTLAKDIGRFIERNGGGETGLFSGQLYSNYNQTSPAIGNAYNAAYIQSQADVGIADSRFQNMVRVMQAQSGGTSGNLLNQAATDHPKLLNDLKDSKSLWLEQLPVIMVDDAAVGTEELLKLLKSSNEVITTNYKLDGRTLETKKHKQNIARQYGYREENTGNVLYYGEKTAVEMVGESIDIELKAVNNADVKDYKKGAVFEHEGKTYQVVSGNLIPNGDFAYGTAGWYDRANNELAMPHWKVEDGVLEHKDNETGENSAQRLGTAWDVKAGKKYVFTIDSAKTSVDSSRNYSEITFPNGTNSKLPTSYDTLTTDTFVFDSGDKDGTLALHFRWLTNEAKYDNFGLYEVKEINPALDAKLGYDGKNLTIDYLFGGDMPEGYTVEVTRQDGTAVGTAVDEAKLTENNNTIILTPSDSNAIYTVTVKAGEKAVGSISASLYSEVVENLENVGYTGENAPNSDMIAKANAVITHGGVYYDGNADTLNAETKKIVEVTETDGKITVTVKEPYKGYGIGFILSGGKIYVGSEDRTITDAEADKVYDSFTVDKNGGTVTLSNAAEVVTLSLDAVNIELAETLAGEIDADGADARYGLVPEI